MSVSWLASEQGQQTIEALRGVDPLRARTMFGHLSVDQVTAALTQARHKPPGYPLRLVTPDGIQQATPVAVAVRRATRLAETTETVIDAGCGIGLDSWAFQQAGMRVLAYEQDRATAEIARANGIEVVCGDVMTAALPEGALYVDPARRLTHAATDGRPIRTHDPQRWRPPLDWVVNHARLARVGPGLREIPAAAEWHCSSIGRTLVDATLWFPPLARVDRRASVLHAGVWHELMGPALPARTGPVQQYILDPDPAIVRTGLVSNAGGHLVDPALAFVTFADEPPAWLGRSMQVLEEVALKSVRAACQRHGLTRVTIWARGFEHIPDLGLRSGQDGVVVLARLGARRTARAWVGLPVTRSVQNSR